MAARLAMSYFPFPELKSVEEVTQKIQKNKLVLILFNTNYTNENNIEHKFNSWRDSYEEKYDLHVYKCVISAQTSELKTEYKITKAPTFVFFRQGKEINRLADVGKVDPNDSLSPKTAEEKLRSWLDHCCTST